MDIQRKALYNSLRMNFLNDPSFSVEPWQVEDYRSLKDETLFNRLEELSVYLDKQSFMSYAAEYETPEELTDSLMASDDEDKTSDDVRDTDRIYLLIFELWRRFGHDQPCLSVFCDEVDWQIDSYDRGTMENLEDIEDALSALQALLDENSDQGAEPQEVFQLISLEFAHNLETFLYDYISEQIENENYLYASDLLDGFSDYVNDVRWFRFLSIRVMAYSNPSEANEKIKLLIEDSQDEPDLELYLEILTFLVQAGERKQFILLMKKTVKLLEIEEDFQELLRICASYCRCIDLDEEEKAIQAILKQRSKNHVEKPMNSNDPQVLSLLKLIEHSTFPPIISNET